MLHTEFSESYNEENSTGEAAVIWQQREQKKLWLSLAIPECAVRSTLLEPVNCI